MQSTMTSQRRIVNPRLHLTAGQEAALREAYCEVFGGREAADARYTGSAYLLPLRPAARAQVAGIPLATLVPLYDTYALTVHASCPVTQYRTLEEASLAEQRANGELDCEQINGTDRLSVPQLLTWDAKARAQSRETYALRMAIAKELARPEYR